MKNQLYPFFLATGLINLNGACSAARPVTEDRPNIIYILADDLGYSELGCYGNTFNETPNLDRLAKSGVRFTQAYAAAPVCSPYRAALMTGLYPARIGITDYLRPDAGQFLDTTYVTLPEALKANGYHTGIIGKWHLSGYKSQNAPIEILPDRQGFDEVISSETAGIGSGTYYHPYHFNPSLPKKLNTEKEFIVDRMNLEALEFIEKNKDKPFFLYLSHYAVHTTLHGQPELVDHFRKKPGCGHSEPSKNNPENDPYKKWPAGHTAGKNNPHLAAQLKVIDDGVGMIRTKLKELGIEKNTIIIFTSDNGGESRVTDNSPLREGKSTLYEGGIREPLIMYQPERISGGKQVDIPVANYDFYPTLCELSRTPVPGSMKHDGKSFAGLLSGNAEPGDQREFYWHYPLEERHFLGGRSSGAVRKGDWKLIEFFDTGEKELYNLKEDIGETNNLFAAHPEKAEELQLLLNEWRKEVSGTAH
ncbi:sulfatase [Gaoshiqia sp. Z1-71]|uniref:sulfatase n=1 Tax=Gaoshiqia hydrogeniformans TaxID=3290090 RepID=UPI003BF78B03